MNDYLGTSHGAIYEMVQSGEPGQSQTWAGKISGVSRDLGSQLAALREHCAVIGSVWSDGVGSVRLTADLGAVIDYLQLLADGLSGQSASYADITVQAAADLTAAQPPAVLPPPPATSPAAPSTNYRQAADSPVQQTFKDERADQVAEQFAANQAAWIQAGETATALDNQYRTALARLTPPPEPPPIVLDTATASGAVDSGGAPGPAAAGGVSAGGSALHAGPAAAPGGWSVDSYLPGGPTVGVLSAGLLSAGQPAPGSPSPGQLGPDGTVNSGGIIGTGGTPNSIGSWVGSPGAAAGFADSAGFRQADVTGSGAPNWPGGGVISAGLLSGGGSALGQRAGIDPAALHGGISGGSVDEATVGLGTGGAAAGQLAHGTLAAAAGTSGTGFGPVTGSAITAGPGRFDSDGSVAGGGGWETAAGVGGIAALAAGAALLSRGGSGAVTAAGLSGGIGPGGSGAGGPGAAGAGNAATGPRGMVSGMWGAGSNSMVQGGQIGQHGRAVSGATSVGTGRPAAAGSGIGGEHGYRVTWLVEDRDLYGKGPSVKSVIEAPPDTE